MLIDVYNLVCSGGPSAFTFLFDFFVKFSRELGLFVHSCNYFKLLAALIKLLDLVVILGRFGDKEKKDEPEDVEAEGKYEPVQIVLRDEVEINCCCDHGERINAANHCPYECYMS